MTDDRKKRPSHYEEDQDLDGANPERNDGDVVFDIAPDKRLLFASLAMTVALGVTVFLMAPAYVQKYLHINPYTRPTLFLLLRILPGVLAVIPVVRRLAPLLFVRWEVSNRFLREIRNYAGIETVETCDVSKILDKTLTNMGPISSIKIITKDRSTPVIHITGVNTGEAKKLFNFIDERSVDNFVERVGYERPKRGPR